MYLILNHAKQEHCIPLPSIHSFHHKGCYVAIWLWVWKINIYGGRAKPWLEIIMQKVSHLPWRSLFYQVLLLSLPVLGGDKLAWTCPQHCRALILSRSACSFPLLPTIFCALDNEQTYMPPTSKTGVRMFLLTHNLKTPGKAQPLKHSLESDKPNQVSAISSSCLLSRRWRQYWLSLMEYALVLFPLPSPHREVKNIFRSLQ